MVTCMPARAPASSNEWATLFPSPMYVSRTPARLPNTSSIVRRSASAWHGWCRSERALITGTVEWAAISSMSLCSNTRAAIADAYPESTRAVSEIGSPRPSWSSSGRISSGAPPSRAIAACSETRVRVDGFWKKQTTVSPASVWRHRLVCRFIV